MRATRMVRIGRRLLAAFCLMTSAGAFAQFPSRPVTIIVPATPGGILDQSSRLVAHELAPLIGQPVVVENRAGGGQIIGMQALLRAEPDGHTMVMGSVGPNAANYSLYSKLPYGPADFAPVAHVVSMSNVLLVHPGVPARTVQELVALAKASPGKLSVASSGNGTSSHLAAEMLKWRAGIDLVHVPYKGAAPAMGDLLGGQVQVMVDNLITALPQIKAGKLRALAVTAGQRAGAAGRAHGCGVRISRLRGHGLGGPAHAGQEPSRSGGLPAPEHRQGAGDAPRQAAPGGDGRGQPADGRD
jgi:tripartite-type tricarboxylate transporter receptor subunit TctC